MRKTHAAIYKTIRYRPNLDTSEFINVGVIMLDLQSFKINLKLLTQHSQRMKSFFDECVCKNYDDHIKNFESSLKSVYEPKPTDDPESLIEKFRQTTKENDSVFDFSQERRIIIKQSNDILDALNGLFFRLT